MNDEGLLRQQNYRLLAAYSAHEIRIDELIVSNRKWVITLIVGMLISMVMGAVFGFWLAGGYS